MATEVTDEEQAPELVCRPPCGRRVVQRPAGLGSETGLRPSFDGNGARPRFIQPAGDNSVPADCHSRTGHGANAWVGRAIHAETRCVEKAAGMA